MVAGVRGRLISGGFARNLLGTVDGAAAFPPAARGALAAWWRRCEAALGPASGPRAIADVMLVPLTRLLGFDLDTRVDRAGLCHLRLLAHRPASAGPAVVAALALPWAGDIGKAWRMTVLDAVSADAGWGFCCNGLVLRIVDARRTWSRDFLEFELGLVAEEPDAQSVLWSVARAQAMAAVPAVLDRAVAMSARHGADVCRTLGAGVLEALQLLLGALAARARGRYPAGVLFEHSLTVLYRVLFLLFAEARSLVPLWHPVYRDRYSLDVIVDALGSGRPYRGLWLALQAISRLAHTGCAAGELRVTPFNGRLFAPVHAASFDRTRIADDVMGQVVLAVSTTTVRGGGRAKIAYRDLDVEQLGSVYEQVLDYQSSESGDQVALVRAGDVRKTTGTFYTPRAITGYLVRSVLEPLSAARSSAEILALRILDPAMGSGAFLVEACRYLAVAAEAALVREGRWHPHDVTAGERAELRRQIASRCLFGVDLNPMAVQLARLSLWLATMAANKPLSFLDHHLVAGNSLVGATPADLTRQPEGRKGHRGRPRALPLFDPLELTATLEAGARVRTALSAEPDDSPAAVGAKERALAAVHETGSALGRWTRALDLWCAGWFWRNGARPDRPTLGALIDGVLRGHSPLPAHVAASWLRHAEALAAHHRFLHWPLAFPEVFAAAGGAPTGFDAIIGNPPWDMVRGDGGEPAVRPDRRRDASDLGAFARESGVYRVESRAHINRYQLFVERALQLVRPGGRIGLVLPAGISSDSGAAPLRRHLFAHAAVEEFTGLDNRAAIFPIHRSVRFVLMCCTAGRPTLAVRCRFGISRATDLERPDAALAPVILTRRFIARLSGEDDLGVPELNGPADLRLLESISARVPRLSSADGWGARFGRELNATDDRRLFERVSTSSTARPVVEGKQIEPFRVAIAGCLQQIRSGCDVSARAPHRPRLAYRDVAGARNRLTLIAAVLPARSVSTHTLFCLKSPGGAADQHVLCALLNSYVANYLVRFRVNTHVTVSLVARLPVPLVHPGEAAYAQLLTWSRALMTGKTPVEDMEEYASLQALVARIYGLAAPDFEHVLSTFPLVPPATRDRALQRFVAPAAAKISHAAASD